MSDPPEGAQLPPQEYGQQHFCDALRAVVLADEKDCVACAARDSTQSAVTLKMLGELEACRAERDSLVARNSENVRLLVEMTSRLAAIRAETRAATLEAALSLLDKVEATRDEFPDQPDSEEEDPFIYGAELGLKRSKQVLRDLLDSDAIPGPVLEELSRRVRMFATSLRAKGDASLADDIDTLLNAYASLNGVRRWESKVKAGAVQQAHKK